MPGTSPDDGVSPDGEHGSRGRASVGLGRRTLLAGTGAAGLAGLAYWRGGRDAPKDGSGSGDDGRDVPQDSSGPTASPPDLIAHRAFAGVYPENTVGAAAAAAGDADAIEIDVVPTADGDVVAFHDDRLAERSDGQDGLTDAEGVVWETDTGTVTGARVLGTDETVPLLADLLNAVPTDVTVNVELKNPGSDDLRFAESLSEDELAAQAAVWRPFVEDVLAVLDGHDHEFLLSSFYEAALATTREAADHAVAPILWDSIDDGLEIARRYDAEAVHPPYEMIRGTPFYGYAARNVGGDAAEEGLLAVAHDEGRDVNVWTVETWYQASQLARAGVDGVIADYPGVVRFLSGESAGGD